MEVGKRLLTGNIARATRADDVEGLRLFVHPIYRRKVAASENAGRVA